ncbi:ImmA/IrrE family metallo-endopeptidase [Corynebacterium phoceense]|nr:ImmA/IrrE family metallo-endopeptidase [Corynebacterium phoceense]
MRAHFNLPALDVPDLSNETPQMAAQLLRSMWNLGTRPAPNLVQLCESRGISVAGLGLEDLLEETHEPVDAFSLWDDGRPYIFTARRRSPEGERFTLAHELGRLVMHPNDPTTPEAESEADALPQNSSFRTRRASNTSPTTHRWRGCSSSKPPFASQPSQPHGACTKSVVAQTGTTRSSIAFSRCADSAPLNLAVVPFTNARASLTRSQATISIRFTIWRLSLAFPPNWPAVSRSKYAFRWSSLAPRRVTVQYPA